MSELRSRPVRDRRRVGVRRHRQRALSAPTCWSSTAGSSPSATGLDADTVVDATGKIVLPGLIDCHVHVLLSDMDSWKTRMTPFSLSFYEAARNMRLTLEAGVTTVRDALGADYGMKRAQELGLITGPGC